MTPDPEAKRRALQRFLVSAVGAPPVMVSETDADLTPLAPPMRTDQEGVATNSPEPDDPIRQELARLRAEADSRARTADLGAVSSRAIEGLTGARGADIWSGMRERADDPLKDFLRLQEMKSKNAPKPQPTADDIKRLQDFARARWPQEPDAVINAIVPERFESIRKTLDSKYGIESREGLAEKQIGATDERARLDREQRAQIWAEQRNLKWADMSLDERKLAESIAAREQAAAMKKEEQVAMATKDFGEAVDKTGAPKFYQQYDEATAIMKKYPKDLPGLGRLDGRVPDEALSPDGRQMRFLVGQLLSEYRKGQTGAGMSDAERAEYAQITGLLYSGNDAAVKQGLDTLKRAIDARVKGLSGAYRPEGVKAYGERVPSVGAVTTPKPPPATSAPPPATTGPRRKRDKSGQLWEEQPDGSAKKVPG